MPPPPPPPPAAPRDGTRHVVSELRRHSLKGFLVCVVALAAAQLLRAVAPAPGTADAQDQMPWVQPHLRALSDAWLAAGGDDAPPGWEVDVLYNNTKRLKSGLAYEDVAVGTGPPLNPSYTIGVLYKLYVASPPGPRGAPRFVYSQSDAAAPLVLRADGAGAVLLPGQVAALAGMTHGGRRRAVLPPRLAFGARANDRVPAFSTLLFFVELLHPPGAAPHGAAAAAAAARGEGHASDDDEVEDDG